MSYNTELAENNTALRALLEQAKGLPDVSAISGKTVYTGTHSQDYDSLMTFDTGVTIKEDAVLIIWCVTPESLGNHSAVMRISPTRTVLFTESTMDGSYFYPYVEEYADASIVAFSGTYVECGLFYAASGLEYHWVLIQ